MFKKIIFFTIIFIFITFAPVRAEERIDKFISEVKINLDSSLDVTEKIFYNFDNAERHEILRSLPLKHKTVSGNLSFDISDVKVSDTNGRPQAFIVERAGKFLNIKIAKAEQSTGNSDAFIIEYKVKRAINFFDFYDEFFWNATGNEWEVEIIRADVKVIFPKEVSYGEMKTKCFAGESDSQSTCFSDNYSYSPEDKTDNHMFFHDNLKAHESLTVLVDLPKGIIARPPLWERMLNFITKYFLYILAVVIFYGVYYWKILSRKNS